MNSMNFTHARKFMVLGVILTMTAVGCKTAPEGVTKIPNQRFDTSEKNLTDGNGIKPTPMDPTAKPGDFGNTPPGPGHVGWPEDPNTLKDQTVYFDFDKSSIKSSETSKLDAVASYLKGNADAAVRVEGNCDERGTEEYNRSLGERRAFAAREYLIKSGVDANRVDTLSNGQDKPADPAHNESAWSKNRRDDFIVLTPPKP